MTECIFENRLDAGNRLARRLSKWRSNPEVIVLGLARGGVPIAHAIAQALHLPMDVLLVRKLGVPGNEELAMGALASGNNLYLNQNIVESLAIPDDIIDKTIQQQRKELARRNALYHNDKTTPDFTNKILILSDDGIATGATVKAALKALRQASPAFIILAIPVAPSSVLPELEPLVEQCHCLLPVENLRAVGYYYQDFSQVSDQEVCRLLEQKS